MSPMAPLRLLNRIHKRSISMPPNSRILLPPTTSRALLLQTTDIPTETARLVRCHNPWPSEDVYFSPEDALPAFVIGVPTLSSGSEVWIAVHNHRPEPLRLHSGQNIGVLEVVTVADAKTSPTRPKSGCQPPIPEHLSPLQQQQLNDLFKEFSDMFSQGEDDLGCRDHHSANPTGGKTRLFGGRRWCRSSKCWPATSSVPPTSRGPHRW